MAHPVPLAEDKSDDVPAGYIPWPGVWEPGTRHLVGPATKMHQYSEKDGGGLWAHSLCFRPAWEAPAELVNDQQPICSECRSLVAEAAA